MKKIIALAVSSIFALSLGYAYAQEEMPKNPWEQQAATSAKKEDKAKKSDTKTSMQKTKKAKAKKTNPEKAKTTEKEKAEKKEPEKKKKFIFW